MSRRTYRQYCPLAKTLDIVGERWTLLIVRELLGGPKRYSDLAANLAGIGTSLLAERLRSLEAEGVVARSYLPPPAASTVYALTEDGVALGEALRPLLLWGARRMDRLRRGDAFRVEWVMSFLATVCDRTAAGGLHEIYEFRFPQGAFHVRVEDGTVTFELGPSAADADVVIETKPDVLLGVANGRVDVSEALREKSLRVSGEPRARQNALRILWPTAPERLDTTRAGMR